MAVGPGCGKALQPGMIVLTIHLVMSLYLQTSDVKPIFILLLIFVKTESNKNNRLRALDRIGLEYFSSVYPPVVLT